ncbi:TPA: hypothetical protein ACPZHQ_004216, partial [Yersinia enterocolitica]
AVTGVSVNGAEFSPTSGFPNTGFVGAQFQILINGSEPTNGQYTWNSDDQQLYTVSNSGLVTFTAPFTTRTVHTITATPAVGGTSLTYQFRVDTWFYNNGATKMSATAANNWCTSSGYTLVARNELVNVLNAGEYGTRQAASNALWSEWGSMNNYSWLTDTSYWSGDVRGADRYSVDLSIGLLGSAMSSTNYYVVCKSVLT